MDVNAEQQIFDRRAKLIRECDALIHAAQTERRDLTDDEKESFDAKELECRNLDEQLERVQRLSRYNGPGQRKTAPDMRAWDGNGERVPRTAATGDGMVSFRDTSNDREIVGYKGTTPIIGPDFVRKNPAIEPFTVPGALGSWFQYQWSSGKDAERFLTRDMRRAMRELRDLSTGDNTLGGYLVPEILSGIFIDRLRAAMVLTRAGAITLPLEGDTRLAREATAPTFVVHTENVEESTTNVVFDDIKLVPRTLMAVVRISDELLADAINGATVIEQVLVRELAVEVDRLGLVGSNPTGLVLTPNINAVTQAPASMDYDDVLDAIDACRQDNAEPNAWILSSATNTVLEKLKVNSEANHYATPPTGVAALQKFVTEAITSSYVLVGNFAEAIIGMRQEIALKRESEVRRNAQLVSCTVRVDFGTMHRESFCKISA